MHDANGGLHRAIGGGVSYAEFIARKTRRHQGAGVEYAAESGVLYPFQSDLVARALERGRSAVFADCGLGKTLIELEWGTNVPGRVLLLAPLAVAYQIEREAERFGFDASRAPGAKITLTNYEKLHQFDTSAFDAVILDESSILKAHTGKTRRRLIEAFASHPRRLACTATPSPNDFMELGNHAEFLGVSTHAEMLSMFFVHDGGSTQDWRLKGHAQRDFWRWVGSWATLIRRPSDLGYDDEGFALPPLRFHHEVCDPVETSVQQLVPGATPLDLNARREARRASLDSRVKAAERLVSENPGPWLLWCDLNAESHAIASHIDGAREVKGADSDEWKTESFLGFADGRFERLVTKPRIGGWGMNWQRCSQMAFVGVSDSYEAMYQAVRRCWRFGQERPVDAWLIYSETERAVVENVMAKDRAHAAMQDALIEEARQ